MEFDTELLRKELVTFLENEKSKDASFSLRALARETDVPASNLSSFISGKRSFSGKTMEKIINFIAPQPEKKIELYKNVLAKEVPAFNKKISGRTKKDVLPEATRMIKEFEKEFSQFLSENKGYDTWELSISLKLKGQD